MKLSHGYCTLVPLVYMCLDGGVAYVRLRGGLLVYFVFIQRVGSVLGCDGALAGQLSIDPAVLLVPFFVLNDIMIHRFEGYVLLRLCLSTW